MKIRKRKKWERKSHLFQDKVTAQPKADVAVAANSTWRQKRGFEKEKMCGLFG